MPNATNAGVPIEINGRLWEFSPLTLEDVEWLELCIKSRAIEAGRMSIPKDTPPDEAAEMMRPVLQEANKISITATPSGMAQAVTPFGITRMLFRMLQRRHAHEITLAQCADWVKDSEIITKIMSNVDLLGGVTKKKLDPPAVEQEIQTKIEQ